MAEEEILKINAISVEPNNCPLDAPLELKLTYTLSRPVEGASWEVLYVADYTGKSKTLQLFSSPAPQDLPAGKPLDFNYHVERVDTSSIKEKYLLQMGLVKLTLHGKTEQNVVSVNLVVQCAKDASGQLTRFIIAPEE